MSNPKTSDLIQRIEDVHGVPYHFLWIDTAWAVMLIKQNLIPKEHVPITVESIIELWDEPAKMGALREGVISYEGFGGLQRYVIEKHGIEYAGNLTLGRTIPPQFQQFPLRRDMLRTMCAIYDLRSVLLDLASNNLDTIMPGYTHMAHAQPTTFGHYLLSIYDPIERIWPRLEMGYSLLNLNELGCGALAGTSWAIDRNMVSEYLGLEGLIENSNDAVSYTDGYLHVVSALTAVASILSRLATDLRMWCTKEYGFVELPPRAPAVPQEKGGKGRSRSHFMPQKTRGADDHEHASAAVAVCMGALNQVATMGIRIPQQDCTEMTRLHAGTRDAFRAVQGIANNYAKVLPTLIVHRERMLASVRQGYSGSTELANHLVRKFGFDYRTAHHIVNLFVIESEDRNLPADDPQVDIFESAAVEVTGKKLGITVEELKRGLDPTHFVQVTNSQGGVAPSETLRMVQERRSRLNDAWEGIVARVERLEGAKDRLYRDVQSL